MPQRYQPFGFTTHWSWGRSLGCNDTGRVSGVGMVNEATRERLDCEAGSSYRSMSFRPSELRRPYVFYPLQPSSLNNHLISHRFFTHSFAWPYPPAPLANGMRPRSARQLYFISYALRLTKLHQSLVGGSLGHRLFIRRLHLSMVHLHIGCRPHAALARSPIKLGVIYVW
jgi:hypothetical protein